jgi:hypothetical protein
MILKIYFVKIIFIFFLISVKCFCQTTFEKIYNFSGNANGYVTCETQDGGYIISGELQYFPSGYNSVYIVKTDLSGNVAWTRIFNISFSDDERARSIRQTSDNGYIITGESLGGSGVYYSIFLIKTDSTGNLIWNKKYSSNGSDNECFNVEETSDKGFIISGATTNTVPCCRNDACIIKTDSTGNLLWSKSYQTFDDYEFCTYVSQTTDGGYILTGNYGGSTSLAKIFLIKTDSLGISEWTKTYGNEHSFCVKQTKDGGYIFCGESDNGLALFKTDSLGGAIWKKVYDRNGTIEIGNYLEQTKDGGYIIAGASGNGIDDIMLIKTDCNGDTLWTKFYGGNNNDMGYFAQEVADSGYIVSGSSSSFGNGIEYSMCLIKTDNNGNSGCNSLNHNLNVFSPLVSDSNVNLGWRPIAWSVTSPTIDVDSGGMALTLCSSTGINNSLDDSNIINIYPNPTAGKFYILFNRNIDSGKIEIYNLIGELTFYREINSSGKISLDIPEGSNGICLIKIFDGREIKLFKLMVEKE